MKKNLISVVLKKSPVPHYLIPETVVISDDAKRISGKMNFPSSETSVRDRGHVNVAHSMLAMWNCAHVLSFLFFKGEKKHLWCVEHTGKAYHVTPMDTDIDVSCTAVSDEKDETRGTFNAEFSLNGKTLQTVSAVFVVR